MDGDNVKEGCVIGFFLGGGGDGGNRRTGNHGTSAINSSHTETSWRLKELSYNRSGDPVPSCDSCRINSGRGSFIAMESLMPLTVCLITTVGSRCG